MTTNPTDDTEAANAIAYAREMREVMQRVLAGEDPGEVVADLESRRASAFAQRRAALEAELAAAIDAEHAAGLRWLESHTKRDD